MLNEAQIQPNLFADPGDTDVVMFEASNRLTGFDGNQIWIGAAGESKDWGSCNVWASQDGTTYLQIGSIDVVARLGVLHSAFSSGADPDTTNALVVDLVPNSGALEAGTTTDADLGTTLCYVQGECIALSACTISGQDRYTMDTYIRRGLMGTTIQSHLSGEAFLRLDGAVFKFTYDPTWAGKTLYFKFQSVNTFGNAAQDLSTLTPVTFTVPGNNPGTVDAASGLVAVHGMRSAHTTYRPLSNPLTATDAGSNATVSIASFSMRVPGLTDISLNSGSITGLSYGTAYYIYYDDPLYVGGAVTYHATTTKEDALNNTGRFFVGSIKTLVALGVSTIGNNDGGTGAQVGSAWTIDPSLRGDDGGTGATPNFQAATGNDIDGDSSTFRDTGTVIAVYLGGFAALQLPWKSLKLRVRTQVTSVGSGGTGFCAYSLDGGANWTNVYSLSTGTRALTTDDFTLSLNQPINQVQVRYGSGTTPGHTRMYRAWIEGVI
jgi:hypothetical protein